MRLWRIPGMPARCPAFLTRILKLHFRLRRVPAPLTISILFTPAVASMPPGSIREPQLMLSGTILTLSLCRSIFSRLSLATLRLAGRGQE